MGRVEARRQEATAARGSCGGPKDPHSRTYPGSAVQAEHGRSAQLLLQHSRCPVHCALHSAFLSLRTHLPSEPHHPHSFCCAQSPQFV